MKRLHQYDMPEVIEFLRREPALNMYLLGVIHRAESNHLWGELGHFYGIRKNGEFQAILYTTFGGLLVPYAPEPADGEFMGTKIRNQVRVRMLVGPREATDNLWRGLKPDFTPRLYRDHRLYQLEASKLAVKPEKRVRQAGPRDLNRLFDTAADMQTEELGIDPRKVDPRQFRRRVARMIQDNVFYVLEEGDSFAFQASASTYCSDGTQVEAVYTPPAMRGKGWATRGLAGMCDNLLRTFPLITLHVNEKNESATRLYERLGFEKRADFRLISC